MKTSKVSFMEKAKYNIKKFITKHKPLSKGDWIRLAVLAVAIPVFIYSTSVLVYRLYKYVQEDNINREIIDLRPSLSDDPFESIDDSDVIEDPITSKFPYQIILGDSSLLNENGILREYENLWNRNNDLVGWINFPNLPRREIDYPVLQAKDNIYYLNYDFNKNRSYSGSIYVDYRNNAFVENPLNIDKNYIITGHAMKNNSMFGTISNFWSDEDAWESAKYIYVDLLNTKLQFEVISAFVTVPEFNYTQIEFEDSDEFIDYVNVLIAKSSNDFKSKKITEHDKIVTLETCFGTGRRTIVVGRLIRQIIYQMPEEFDEDETIIEHITKEQTPEETATPIITPVELPKDIPANVPFPTEAREVMSLIDKIPSNITFNNIEYIYEVYEIFEDLDNYQTGAVNDSHKNKLNAAKEKADELHEISLDNIKPVVSSISKLPAFDIIALSDKPKIDSTRNMYDGLNSYEKKIMDVNAYNVLLRAETKIRDLTKAEPVIALIKDLPTVENLDLSNENAVVFARTEYNKYVDKLTAGQKNLVTNIAKLQELEIKLKQLKESQSSSSESQSQSPSSSIDDSDSSSESTESSTDSSSQETSQPDSSSEIDNP